MEKFKFQNPNTKENLKFNPQATVADPRAMCSLRDFEIWTLKFPWILTIEF